MVTVSGTLAADQDVTLSLKVSGRVGDLNVDLGSRIQRGQILARLEQTDFDLRVRQAQAALQQARALLGLDPNSDVTTVIPEDTGVVRQTAAVMEQARLTRDRMTSLHEQGLIAQSQLDDALAGFRVAEARYQDSLEEVRNRQALLSQRQAELEIAKQQRVDSAVISPLDGAVEERMISRGQFLAAGAPAFRVVCGNPLRLRLSIPEREAGGVRKGQKVEVTVEGDDSIHPGAVARVSPALSTDNRTLAVEAEVPNENGALRPGSFARANIVVQSDEPAVLVPATSIVTFAGIDKVITIKDNVTEEKRVHTGRRSGDSVEIVDGLNAGEIVVVEPGNLVGGESVTPVR
ncbi:MAG TPA: efflux RND transporter periplasmic adaptor subunit [Acidobacteriota bacterium]|nr:efflux RND transporter periplasmic adaptor subunit [Acidobacteriota bacterium]